MTFLQENLQINIISIVNIHQKQRDEYISKTPYHAISFRFSGDTDFILDGKKYTAKKNNILFLPKMIHYKHITNKPEHLIVVHFEANINPDCKIEVFSSENNAILRGLFESAYNIWSAKKIGYKYDATATVYKIFSQLQQQSLAHNSLLSSQKLKYALEYIHENYTKPELNVSSVANFLGMSETYFRKLFYKNLQKTPHDYINRLRLCYAEELLRSGYYNVSEVSNMSGFSDPNYFSTAMKKATGIPPSKMIKYSQ